MMTFLADWGFPPELAATLDDHEQPGESSPFLIARVVEPGRNEIHLITGHGPLVAEPSGRIDADGTPWPPAVGDWVVALPLDDQRGMVQRVLPRINSLARSGGAAAQPLAANVDVGLILLPFPGPVRLNLVERSLALVRGGGVFPAVALTKADLDADAQTERMRVADVAGDAPVHAISVVTGEGLDRLDPLFAPGTTVALLGKSGAGKSSLVNRLAGADLMATGAVREGDQKGRHTTTSRRLLRLPSGAMVIDLPGFRELGLTGDEEEGLAETFPEIEVLAARCRFADCAHEGEPGCAVIAAVENGTLTPRRLESYRKLMKESASAALRADEAARRAHDRRFGRMVKNALKTKDRGERP